MKFTAAWLCVVWLTAVATSVAATGPRELEERIDSDDFQLPAPRSLGERLQLWATWYHVTRVNAIPDGIRLLNIRGQPISPPIHGRDWCLGALEGVIMIKSADGAKRTYTYETTVQRQQVDCGDYFKRRAVWARMAGRSRRHLQWPFCPDFQT